MMRAIRPFMNGELPIRSPVSGLRNGAPGGSVSRPKKTRTPISAEQRVPQAARFVGGELCLRRCSSAGFSPLYSPRRGSIDSFGDEGDDDRQEHDGRDGKPEVGGQADGHVGIDQVDGVVGELDEDGIERLDQHVHGEGAGDRGKAQRPARRADAGRR